MNYSMEQDHLFKADGYIWKSVYDKVGCTYWAISIGTYPVRQSVCGYLTLSDLAANLAAGYHKEVANS